MDLFPVELWLGNLDADGEFVPAVQGERTEDGGWVFPGPWSATFLKADDLKPIPVENFIKVSKEPVT